MVKAAPQPVGETTGTAEIRRSSRSISRLRRAEAVVTSGRLAPTLIVALVLTIISWPVTDLTPYAGLDPSWEGGLAMAFVQHLHWGPNIDFTYGPLGFLTVPMLYFQSTAALSLIYLVASRVLLFALLLRTIQPKVPGLWAILLAYIVGASAIFLIDSADLLMGCALLIGLLALASPSTVFHSGRYSRSPVLESYHTRIRCPVEGSMNTSVVGLGPAPLAELLRLPR